MTKVFLDSCTCTLQHNNYQIYEMVEGGGSSNSFGGFEKALCHEFSKRDSIKIPPLSLEFRYASKPQTSAIFSISILNIINPIV